MIYYRDTEVHITSAGIRVNGSWYPLAELTAVWHSRHRRPFRYGSTLLASVALFAAVVVPVLVCGGWGLVWALGRPGTAGAAMVLFGVLAVVAVAAIAGRTAIELPLSLLDRLHLHGTARHELRADWRGEEIVVFATDDAHRFGKVYRSLRRAIEHAHRP